MQKSQTNFLTYRFLIAIDHPTENMLKIGREVLTCEAALSQLSTSAAPPDRELPRSLPSPALTRPTLHEMGRTKRTLGPQTLATGTI